MKQTRSDPSITNTTNIGSVTGQVHTGSGNIEVHHVGSSSDIESKEAFLAVLARICKQLEQIPASAVQGDAAQVALAEVRHAQNGAHAEPTKHSDISRSLRKAKEILLSGAGVATAAKGAISAVRELVPLIESAINAASKLF